MYVIVGLGNPGEKYAHTRHNAGFDAIHAICDEFKINMDTGKFKGIVGSGYIEGQKVLLVKPMTYMNLSGECVREVMNFYKIDPEEELIVLFDDISLAPGQLRIRKKGSAGGHNGIKNIILHCGTDGFKRVKIGVGEKPKEWDLVDHVLGRVPEEDQPKMQEAFKNTADAVRMIIAGDVEAAMNRYNAKADKKPKQKKPRIVKEEMETSQTEEAE